jgi:peptidoglycan-N-acetylglucosamine deacetylase
MKVLTIDLEEWFHILDHPSTAHPSQWAGMESRIGANVDRIRSLLEKHSQPATWFCLGWVARKYPSLVRSLADNYDVGCHSGDHQLLFSQSPAAAREDISSSVKMLEDLCGRKIISYRAPGFSFTRETPWLVDILAENGIGIDSSIFPARRNHGGFDGFPFQSPCLIEHGGSTIKEFPMNTAVIAGKRMVCSGGGYFRLLPYPIIRRMMNDSPYVMTYFHPRDFDPGQPLIGSLPLKRKFMSYVGLKNSLRKFDRLLGEFRFVDIATAAAGMKDLPVVRLPLKQSI